MRLALAEGSPSPPPFLISLRFQASASYLFSVDTDPLSSSTSSGTALREKNMMPKLGAASRGPLLMEGQSEGAKPKSSALCAN